MKTESTLDPGSALQEGERIFARAWKLLALRGAIAILGLVVGVAVLVWPDLSAKALLLGAKPVTHG